MAQEIEVKLTIPPSLIRDPIANPVHDYFSPLITNTRVVKQTDSYRETDGPQLVRFRAHENEGDIIYSRKSYLPIVAELLERCESDVVISSGHTKETIHKTTRSIAPYLKEYAFCSVRRTLLMIEDGPNRAEVTIDLGRAESGEVKAVISEIELELKQGSVEWLKDTAFLLKSHIFENYGFKMQASPSKGHLANITSDLNYARQNRRQTPSP